MKLKLILGWGLLALAVQAQDAPRIDTNPAPAAPSSQPANSIHYVLEKDQPCFLEADILKMDSQATIVRSKEYFQQGDDYFVVNGAAAGPDEVYLEKQGDWLEPVTPPDPSQMPVCGPTEIRLVEVTGSVKVFLPDHPDQEQKPELGMVIPSGSVLKTDADGMVTLLLGGINSVRVTSNSEVRCEQSMESDKLRNTLLSLQKGILFSKVGSRLGEAQVFKVKTPLGVAAARGTDFVTVAMPDRMDVWIAQGKVELRNEKDEMMGTVASDVPGALKIIRNPPIDDPQKNMMADSATMSTAIGMLPKMNVKLAPIREKQDKGESLTAQEQKYLSHILAVHWLVKARKAGAPAPEAAPQANPPPAQGSTNTLPAAPNIGTAP